ncbi:MAG: diguanylate cyclase [Lachnospiraceae bacterium]|nr:diguanylate cyclase [Lachnospiraceae bacterium]
MPKQTKNGISHRQVHRWLVIIILIFSGTVVYATLRLVGTFWDITEASRQNSELQNAAHELMNASDYLTEQVQRFTVGGETRFMDQYFTEAFESQRREEAIARMGGNDKTEAALAKLQEAMDGSVALMSREYYAMRLVVEAKGITEYPAVLDTVTLSEADLALTPTEQMALATQMVLDDEYYEQKDRIRTAMEGSLEEVEKLTQSIAEREMHSLTQEIALVRVAIVIQAVLIFFLIWLTTRLAINPIMSAVDQIKEGLPIEEKGSNEFRYLASAYNKIYEKNKSSIESLSYIASHDELTGAYNRAGYDLLLSDLDLNSTYMLLLDVDNFKLINDTYGHEVGDRILAKVVSVLNKAFRDKDYICRIGGDEFVIFLMYSGDIQHRVIESKIAQISRDLENTEDGLPPVTISIGIMDGKYASDSKDLFEKTDEAMYESKKQGKKSYTFYDDRVK